MLSYRKYNNITGWCLAALSFTVYLLSMERTASFWDCGEFLACAYKLEVGHSPGAPFFMLLQRIAALFSGTAALLARPSVKAAYAINLFSVLTSALTILFLFWTITSLTRRIVCGKAAPVRRQGLLILAAGIIGALAYTFSDTFWFSAVEAEVYATSSFFTAVVFWAILKWEAIADEPHADSWLVLIAYLVGISVGVHLLNLLTIPAIAMVCYFRKYRTSLPGTVFAFLAGCLLLALVQFGVIQYLPIMASALELFFVNSLGMPFGSGALVFLLLLVTALAWSLLYVRKKRWYRAHTGLLCLLFIIVGFSSYIIPVIRSSAGTPVNVNNPDNVLALVPYVQREQYIHPPMLYGQDYDSRITGIEEGKQFYYPVKDKNGHRYQPAGSKFSYTYDPADLRFFPRIWDNYEPVHQQFYRNYLGLAEGERPTGQDNLHYFWSYQMNTLWWRYFMWNYAGRQNDYEGQGEARNGNWISGIPFLDHARAGNMRLMSAPYRNNAARNELYCLPLLLGVLGMVYHYRTVRKDAFVITLLFFFTGIAIALYLNMNPLQPRERDYAFAGCTYAFALWIGIGLLSVEKALARWLPGISIAAAFLLCLAVPLLMLKEEWNDHTRSGKTLAQATARNTLLSCAPNAILFTQGDNDTYPLWYLQEVEGVRTDVRVVITELLNADWYINQLNNKVNDADAVPMIWKQEDYMGEQNNYVSYFANPKIPQERYFDLYEVCRFVTGRAPGTTVQNNAGKEVSYLPSKNFSLPLPRDLRQEPAVVPGAGDKLFFSIKGDGVQKKELAIMNILAANAHNGWKRPVYFNGSYPNREDVLGLMPYMRMEGIVYRLAPFTAGDYDARTRQVNNIDVDRSLYLFSRQYRYGGAEKQDVYFDEKNRVMLMSYRINSVELAERLTAMNRQKEAVILLDKMLACITPASYPHDDLSLFMSEAYYHAGAKEKGARLAKLLGDNARQDMAWINDLDERQRESEQNALRKDMALLQRLAETAKLAGDLETADYLGGNHKEHPEPVNYGLQQ